LTHLVVADPQLAVRLQIQLGSLADPPRGDRGGSASPPRRRRRDRSRFPRGLLRFQIPGQFPGTNRWLIRAPSPR
jgi:hypothetical protein